MSDRDLRLDVGQLLWVGFAGHTLTRAERERFLGGRAGGAILFARNIDCEPELNVGALVDLTCELHELGARADQPLLVAVDQEGGRVQRIRAPATVWPAMRTLDALDDERAVEIASEIGKAIALELVALGFDIDFAPVLDVHTNPDNPIIGDRAFSSDVSRVCERAMAFATAMRGAGLLPCGKHFPGHGDTDTDSHLALPRLAHDMDRLENVELMPFRRAAAEGVPLVMTAHIVFAALDAGVPATLSRAAVTDLLRKSIGYRGLVVSDDMDMMAIAAHYGAAEAAVQAIDAGCDALLLCKNPDSQDQAYEALVRAAEARSSFRERVGASAAAIRTLKKRHFKGQVRPTRAQAENVLGQARHAAFFAELERAV